MARPKKASTLDRLKALSEESARIDAAKAELETRLKVEVGEIASRIPGAFLLPPDVVAGALAKAVEAHRENGEALAVLVAAGERFSLSKRPRKGGKGAVPSPDAGEGSGGSGEVSGVQGAAGTETVQHG